MRARLAAIVVAATAVGVAASGRAAGPASQGPVARSGIDLASIDRRVRPQDDLYRFANGGWLDRTTIPAEATTWTAGSEVAATVERDLRAIVDAIAAGPRPAPGSPQQQIVDLFASLMDVDAIERRGTAPIDEVLRRIDAIGTTAEFSATCGYLASIGVAGPFGAVLVVDPGNPRNATARLSPGGIMLPGPDYYTSADPAMTRLRDAYRAYLESIFRLVGRADPGADAASVIAIDTAIAVAHPTSTSATAAVVRRSLRDLSSGMPGFDWRAWAEPQGLDRASGLLVSHEPFFAAFADVVRREPIDRWRAWLVARYVTASAPFLGRAFESARFEFFGRVLTGQTAPIERWRRGVSLVNAYLGDAIGRLYVDRHFPESSRRRVDRIAREVVQAWRDAIDESPWLEPASRGVVRRKLDALTRRVGFPAQWRSYRGLEIRRDDLVGNVERAKRADVVYRLNGGAAPGSGWLMPAQTVNAYYATGLNELVLPAGILQPPFFDAAADEAVNYGAIGAVIGHEIGHALFGAGRYVDGAGQGRDWWTAGEARAFERFARQLADGYGRAMAGLGFEVDPGRVLDEHVGDLAGLAVAFQAYRRTLRDQPAPVLDGFTGPQRFFLGWAQLWRSKVRDEYLRQWLTTTVHPPGWFRANGVVAHLDAFHEAFDVREGDRLHTPPAARVRVW